MALWQAMAKAFNKDTTLHDLTATQCEAVIDALTLILYADGKASFLETTELEHLLHEMPWTHNNAAVDAYTEASAERVAALSGADAIDAFSASIAARLPAEADVREKAYELAARLAHADWQVRAGERTMLDSLSRNLGIAADRAAQIDKKVADETI